MKMTLENIYNIMKEKLNEMHDGKKVELSNAEAMYLFKVICDMMHIKRITDEV